MSSVAYNMFAAIEVIVREQANNFTQILYKYVAHEAHKKFR